MLKMQEMGFAAGAELGNYRLIDQIGAGGMGEVWRAEDKRLGRTVAIKILPLSLAADVEARARLEREARTAALLYHPNIATIHSLDEAHGRAFIVMEYVEGEPLSQAIARGPMSEAEVCRIGRAVADALAEAHQHGIVHRDIKPDNVILAGARVKVLDFGIAKRVGPTAGGANTSQPLTEAGMILGTVQYMSPEQALGRPLDGRSDIFSLGVVLYQMLAGRLPFAGESVTDVLTRIIRDDAPDVTAVVPTVNASLGEVVRRSLQKDPARRFSSAAEVRDALDALTPTARSAPSPTRTAVYVDPNAATVITGARTVPTTAARRSSFFVPLAVLALLALGAALFLFRPGRESATKEGELKVSAVPAETSSVNEVVEVVAPSVATATAAEVATKVVAPEVSAAPSPATTSQPAAASESTVDVAEQPAGNESVIADRSYASALQLMRAGRERAALVAFQRTIAADAGHAPAHLRSGALLLAGGRKERAGSAFAAALRHASRLDEREQMLARIGSAVTAGDVDQARELGAAFQARWPDDPELRYLRGAVEGNVPGPGRRRGPRRRD